MQDSFKSASSEFGTKATYTSKDIPAYMQGVIKEATAICQNKGNPYDGSTRQSAAGVLQEVIHILNKRIPAFDEENQSLFAQLLRNEIQAIQPKLPSTDDAFKALKTLKENGTMHRAPAPVEAARPVAEVS